MAAGESCAWDREKLHQPVCGEADAELTAPAERGGGGGRNKSKGENLPDVRGGKREKVGEGFGDRDHCSATNPSWVNWPLKSQ